MDSPKAQSGLKYAYIRKKNKLAFDFNSVTYPCGDRYDSYECVYDAVYDFKKQKVYFDKSVIMGQ